MGQPEARRILRPNVGGLSRVAAHGALYGLRELAVRLAAGALLKQCQGPASLCRRRGL